MHNRTWSFQNCCPFVHVWTCCGQLWWVYTIARVKASHREIQFLIVNLIVLIFTVLLQALFGNGHFSYGKNVLLLLSVACGGYVWQVSLCGRRKRVVLKKIFPTVYHVSWLYLLKLLFSFSFNITCVFAENNLAVLI